MAGVTFRNVTKIYPKKRVKNENGETEIKDVVGCRNINLEVKDKEFCVLVGPSGCGKSTSLRMVAGLEEITEGEIYIGDQLINDVPPKDRNIAMVFQNYALYPHMNAYENMSFALRLKKFPKEEIKQRVEEAAKILGIFHLLDRKPAALSGGEKQRVAVGRAIVRKPKVFLFDEPLSNLDAKLRMEMRAEIVKLHEALKTTMIYVTHDQVEAMTMGDKIVVMKSGLIQQVDVPMSLYKNPENKFVAGFIGSPPMNFMECTVIKGKEGLYLDEGMFKVKIIEEMEETIRPYLNKKVVLGIRAEDIYDKLYARNATKDNTIIATVELIEPLGAEIYLHMRTSPGKDFFISRVDANNKAKLAQKIELVFDMKKIHIFDMDKLKDITDKETEKAVTII
ncbi:sn-glycerol-3-phosphate ABC transporter ATP-binding protein UgpC [bacterium]|nr:sn-glycerol-3-phosphate ABC transporter ATP-binding protein UgpC [bacterium]